MRLIIGDFRFTYRIGLVLLILSPAPARGLEDKIVFVSNRNGTPEVYLVEGLDGIPIQLTRNRFASWPSISPDGTEIVFVSSPPGGTSNIFKLRIATRKTEKLTDDAEDTRYTDLDWSPDGPQILFIKALRILDSEPEKTDLCVMDMKTRDTRHILQPQRPTAVFHPSWSPDSQHILYLHLRKSQKDSEPYTLTLFITDDNGNNVVEVTRDSFGIVPEWLSPIAVPTWSPRRSQIAYVDFVATNPPPNPFQIYSMNLNDGLVAALTSDGAENRFPAAWHPDGRKILFWISSALHQKAELADIYVMDPDGKNMINLTQSPEREVTASWAPDGQRIAFGRWLNERDAAIFVMDADGQNQQRLTFEPGVHLAPHWSPDGIKIAFLSIRDWAQRVSDGEHQIYTVETNGQNVQQITQRRRKYYTPPAWSPDGKWLAFGAGDKRSWGIYLIDPQGDNETLIFRKELNTLNGFARVSRPTWSPDGQHLIYIDPESEDDVDLMKIRVDGGMPMHLKTVGLEQQWLSVWSPDGNSLLFSAREQREPFDVEQAEAIFLMNLHTSESRHFILPDMKESGWNFHRLVWSPDGSQLMLSSKATRRLYLIDIASETVRLWMTDADAADWVRPGFVYAVNPRGKCIVTWAQMKSRKGTDAQVIP